MNPNKHILKHSDILKNFLEEQNISVTEVAKILGYTRPSIYDKFLNKSRFTDDQIYVLNRVLGISTKLFGKLYNEVTPRFIEKEAASGQFLSYNVARVKGVTYSDFLRSYFEPLITELKTAQESITVVDSVTENWHIGAKINAETGDVKSYNTFKELYKEYLEELEKALVRCLAHKKLSGHKKPIYRRIFQLPLRPCVFKPSDHHSGALNWIYVETVNHINRLYAKFEKPQKKQMSDLDELLDSFQLLETENIEFYVMPQPMRQYSFMIIDNQTIVTEYLKINKFGEQYPDIVYIQNADKKDPSDMVYQMLQSYNYQIDTTLSSKNALNISPSYLKSKLEILVKDYEKQILEKGERQRQIEVRLDAIKDDVNTLEIEDNNALNPVDAFINSQKEKVIEELTILNIGYKVAKKKLSLF